MRFLRLLFWLLLLLVVGLFMGRNWTDATLDLWGNVRADIKLPLLLLIAFLLGYLPTTLRWRLRHWRMKRAATVSPAHAVRAPARALPEEPAS